MKLNMIIAKKLNDGYKNQIEYIKNEKNYLRKRELIGTLVLDLGKRSISAVANACGCCWRYVNKCYLMVKNKLPNLSNKNKCGRKSLFQIYPTLKEDITKIVENHCITDPRFKSEKQYVRLSIKEIKKQLVETGKYNSESFSDSALNNLVNFMGYNLKKVQKIKPLKKIKETDAIFDNVHKKREEAMNDNKTALFSIDTKDKVSLGPFSREGKNRTKVSATDHNLTNKCLIPFGILDLKKNKPYFFNFEQKPTSLDLVDCIEEFYRREYLNTEINKLAILLDNGPDNSGVRTIFLKGLIEMSKKYNIEIELIYYPPYHSKYNPVERLWARLENIWNGYLLENKDICIKFMKNLTWKENSSVTLEMTKKYEKGLKVEKKEMKKLEKDYITRKEGIEKWSVIITP